MKSLLVIGSVTMTMLALSGCAWGNTTTPPANNQVNNSVTAGTLKICPDEQIVNSMPGIGGNESYYILDGKRREVSEFDSTWVEKNCQVPVQEVQ